MKLSQKLIIYTQNMIVSNAYHRVNIYDSFKEIIDKYVRQIEKLEESLAFYANENNWEESNKYPEDNNMYSMTTNIEEDYGLRAKEALKESTK